MNIFRGLNGTICIIDNNIVITRENRIDRTFHNTIRTVIPIERIKKVVVVLGSIVNGHITIVEKGVKEPCGVWNAIHDDNTVVFRLFNNYAAEKFANEVRDLIE